jgi:hypothetical protein
MKLDIITIIKCIALMYISILFVVSGIFTTHLCDKYIFSNRLSKNDNNKSIIRLTLEISIIIGFITILSYIGRNLIQLIPFPLDNFNGFQYSRVKELQTGTLLTVSLLLYNLTLSSKVTILKEKLAKKN